ncbi:MAG TPA: hypothetical protein EYN69_06085, partial [Flavobacteriales bacterium]|nr:hypothetical protein [Flavobacteriales bacterium]
MKEFKDTSKTLPVHFSNYINCCLRIALLLFVILNPFIGKSQTTPSTSDFGCLSIYQNMYVGNWTEEGWQAHGKWYFDNGMNGTITDCNGNNVTIKKWVKQKYNQSPTWWVGSHDMIDVEITGTMRVYDSSDEDWIGFVFGYQGPFGPNSVSNGIDADFLLFDWKQRKESSNDEEGFSLARINGYLPHNMVWSTLCYHNPYLSVYDTLGTRYGSTEGWLDKKKNHFKLIYTRTNATIIINQVGPVSTNPSTNDTIFNVNGTYNPGRFGFYNCSQDNSIYGDLRYRFMKDFEVSDSVICKGQTAEFNYLANDEMNFNYDLIKNMSWVYGDGNIDTISFPDSLNINITHTYDTAGTFNVMLILENCSGCIDTIYNTINVTNSAVNLNAVSYPLCYGDTTGAIDILVTGGTSPYTYSWSNGDTTEDLYNLGSGIYSVIVNDGNQCADTLTVTMDQPPLLQAAAMVINNASCFGFNDGDAIVNAVGGTSAYTYNWSNGPNTSYNLNLSAGTYTVTVTDANGCNDTGSAVISEPAVLMVTA